VKNDDKVMQKVATQLANQPVLQEFNLLSTQFQKIGTTLHSIHEVGIACSS
jgi:hypothetical protein